MYRATHSLPSAGATRIAYVLGARPNFVKMAPVISELRRRMPDGRHALIHTGQHYDRLMSDVFLEELGVPAPDHMLGVASASHAIQTARVMERIEPVLEEEINRIVADEFSEQHDDRHPSFFGRRDGVTLRQTSVAPVTTPPAPRTSTVRAPGNHRHRVTSTRGIRHALAALPQITTWPGDRLGDDAFTPSQESQGLSTLTSWRLQVGLCCVTRIAGSRRRWSVGCERAGRARKK
jgi:hypothetical protein